MMKPQEITEDGARRDIREARTGKVAAFGDIDVIGIDLSAIVDTPRRGLAAPGVA